MSEPIFAARHSMDSAEWYTPPAFVEAARTVMGGIDLDPASHPEANATIKARKFYTVEDDGLIQPWRGRVFLNPPGGLVGEFWRKLARDFRYTFVEQAVWIGYSLEQLQTLQGRADFHPLDFPLCVPDRRIAFVENSAKAEARAAKGKRAASSPSHGNYICYLGSDPSRFVQEFGRFGKVIA